MHQFSTELCSTSESMLIPYFHTDSPFIYGFPSSSNDHHSNSLQHIAFNHHVQPKSPQVHIWGYIWHRDGRSPQAQMHPQIDTVCLITPVYSTWAVPHHSTSHWSSAYSYGTHCGFQAYCTSNDIAITSSIPTDPLFPPCPRPQRPYHLGEDIMEVRRAMHFMLWVSALHYSARDRVMEGFRTVASARALCLLS